MNLLAIEVPGDAIRLRIGKTALTKKFLYAAGGYDGYKFPLPPGEWEILFTTGNMTEEDAKGVVGEEIRPDFNTGENVLAGFTRYDGNGVCDTALESFHSWLRANNYDTGKNYVILKNTKQQQQ